MLQSVPRFALLFALLLGSAGLAQAQPVPAPVPPKQVPQDPQLDWQLRRLQRQNQLQLVPGQNIIIRRGGGFHRGGIIYPNGIGNQTTQDLRLGASLAVVHPALIDQLDLPKEQGVAVSDVLPDSPAAKAGLKTGDIMLELDGKAVSNKPPEFSKQINNIKADTPVSAVIVRRGRKETIKGISLPEGAAKDAPK